MAELPLEGQSIFGPRARPDYVIDENGCWVWQKATLRGYAQGRVHRLYYERAYGPVPDGAHVHHKCKNPSCLNPEHLEALSPREHFYAHALENMGLSAEQVDEVRRLAHTREKTQRQIAEQFGIAQSSVSRLANGLRWSAERIELPPKSCPVCGAPVYGKTRSTYCSKECRRLAHNARVSARYYAKKEAQSNAL